MPRSTPETVKEYIDSFPKDTQKVLKEIRTTIKKLAPQAEEVISYAIPCFKLNGSPVIYFAGFKSHVSVYPAPRGNEAFSEELAAYKGGKGTVQFPLDKPLPLDLIARMVKFRMKENAEKTAKSKPKSAKKQQQVS
jgi:uncharacterized protein YdhG (YjbR/CyaY superfamily)